MKKLLILFLALGLFTACNNNGKNPFAKKTDSEKTEESSDDKEEKKKKGGLFSKKDDDNTVENSSKSTWTKSYRDDLIKKCEDEMSDDPQGRSICACAVAKLEKKYPDTKDADEAIETVAEGILAQCRTGGGGGDGYTDDRYKTREIDVPVDEGSNGKSWTMLQRQQSIQSCEVAARNNNQAGYSAQQINSYCDCMTRKLEKKHSFQQASKMTAADFQTQEWQSAAADCMPRN
jgi:hypothetical protein